MADHSSDTPVAERKIGNGYHEVQLNCWRDFVSYVCDEMRNYQSYIWRGHRRADWKLEPTLSRLQREAAVSTVQDWNFALQHLEKFKFAVRGRRGQSPPEPKDENEWWALGQHHGLATPLLDWTTSPFVAAFFAFYDDVSRDQTEHRAIFALHAPTLEGWATRKAREENRRRGEDEQVRRAAGLPIGGLMSAALFPAAPELVLVRPMSDDNPRLVSQGGLFTRLTAPNKVLEEWVTENHPGDDNEISLLKVLIPSGDRDICLQTLNRMNINPLSLFPDLTGASRYTNLHTEIENY